MSKVLRLYVDKPVTVKSNSVTAGYGQFLTISK